ncbi:MAG: nickel insertion protein [Marinilabilia sp.]
MKLFIRPEGGIAGDMFAAALIDAGAGAEDVTKAMQTAAEKLGRASVRYLKTADGCGRLHIEVEHHHGHLSSNKAIELLDELYDELSIKQPYRTFGQSMLNHLIKAEKEAHETYDFDMGHHHHHHHHHVGGHHHHHEEPEAWLHEAQDILIDVTGAVMGLQLLSAPVKAELTCPVSWGGGSVSFSHGTLKVPAPATEMMIKNNKIPVTAGPIETELFTPTGAALLSALSANEVTEIKDKAALVKGCSRGTKDLPVEPLKIFLLK